MHLQTSNDFNTILIYFILILCTLYTYIVVHSLWMTHVEESKHVGVLEF